MALIIPLVLFIFTFIPLLSIPHFQWLSFLIIAFCYHSQIIRIRRSPGTASLNYLNIAQYRRQSLASGAKESFKGAHSERYTGQLFLWGQASTPSHPSMAPALILPPSLSQTAMGFTLELSLLVLPWTVLTVTVVAPSSQTLLLILAIHQHPACALPISSLALVDYQTLLPDPQIWNTVSCFSLHISLHLNCIVSHW